jgi:transposase
MKKGNVYRIYPDKEQRTLLEKYFGAARFVYNHSLSIKNLMYNKFRINMSGFIQKLTYKAEWFGKTILKIGRFEVSSKLYNVCGYKKFDLDLKIREWECPSCKTLHDRDKNASINIKKIALANVNTHVTWGRAYGLTGEGQGKEVGSHLF